MRTALIAIAASAVFAATSGAVETLPAENVTTSSAVLRMRVTTTNRGALVSFMYNPTVVIPGQHYNAQTEQKLIYGTNVIYTATLTGLPCGTAFRYAADVQHVRLSSETGDYVTFTTAPCPGFSITTNNATNVTHRSATLNATVQPPGGGSATVTFRYRVDPYSNYFTYTHETPPQTVSGTNAVASHTIGPLQCATRYTYNSFVTSGGVTVAGREVSFQTATCSSAESDFDGDGQVDLVWRDRSTGENSVWLMNGGTRSSTVALPSLPTEWDIIGSTKAIGAAWPNLVIYRPSTGHARMMFMNGTTSTGMADIGSAATDTWRLLAVSHLGVTASGDLVWLKIPTNDLLIWFLNSSQYSSAKWAPKNPGGTLGATADFDRNGIADFIWRDPGDGYVSVHLLNTDHTRKAIYRLPMLPSNFIIAGAADINRDTFPDILVRNMTTGRIFVWTCWYTVTSGVTVTSSFAIIPDAPPSLTLVSPR